MKSGVTLARGLSYLSGETDDPGFYERLAKTVAAHAPDGVLFYLAIPPTVYGKVVAQLGAAGLTRPPNPSGWRRLVVEKPFGTDLDSARALNALLHQHLDESQVFRIDHYLGKETVQNLLVFRFANGMFEPVWNRRYIDHVQITAAETVGVEQRAAYYEQAGALRDMVQNHLMQLLSLIAMEPPITFSAENVRDRKLDALLSIQPLLEGNDKTNVIRAQYASGWVNGTEVPGYRRGRREPHVGDRDLRRLEASPRQLALGGRAVLHSNRKTSGEADDRDCDPVPPSAAPHLQASESDANCVEPSGRQRAAG